MKITQGRYQKLYMPSFVIFGNLLISWWSSTPIEHRENLQLHSIGLIKLNNDGTPVLNSFGKKIANYEQKHIFTAAKIWTGFEPSYRRGNYEELDWATTSYLDPLQIKRVEDRDWFPKIDFDSGYIGDGYPLCSDLPDKHFLKRKATYRLLGGTLGVTSSNGQYP